MSACGRTLGSMDSRVAEVEETWRAEIVRRRDDVLSDQPQLGDFETTRAAFEARFPVPES